MEEADATRRHGEFEGQVPIRLPPRNIVPEVFLLSWDALKRTRRAARSASMAQAAFTTYGGSQAGGDVRTNTSESTVLHDTQLNVVRVKDEPHDDSALPAQKAVSGILSRKYFCTSSLMLVLCRMEGLRKRKMTRTKRFLTLSRIMFIRRTRM